MRNPAVVVVLFGMIAANAPAADPFNAQIDALTPKFEVASIKHCAPGGRGGMAGQPVPGRITVNCQSVMGLIRQAYLVFANGRMNLLQDKLIPMEKSPVWVDSELYTIEAKAESKPGQAAPGQGMMLGPMMQALLEDRFGLKIRREIRQAPVYALIVGKDGTKLQSAQEGRCVVQDLDQPLVRMAPGQVRLPFCGFGLRTSEGYDFRGTTLTQLCAMLSLQVDRRVIDNTAIAGKFDVRLDLSGTDLPPAAPPPPPQPGDPSPVGPDRGEMTAAVQSALQKLGLKLEPIQGSEEVLIIDHVEKPSEN